MVYRRGRVNLESLPLPRSFNYEELLEFQRIGCVRRCMGILDVAN